VEGKEVAFCIANICTVLLLYRPRAYLPEQTLPLSINFVNIVLIVSTIRLHKWCSILWSHLRLKPCLHIVHTCMFGLRGSALHRP
jgi:hypothetical protein